MKFYLKTSLLICFIMILYSCKQENIFTDKELAASYDSYLKDKSPTKIDAIINMAGKKLNELNDKNEKLSIIESMIKFTEDNNLMDQNLGFIKQKAAINPDPKIFKLLSERLAKKESSFAELYECAILNNFSESSEAKSLASKKVKSKEELLKMVDEIISDTTTIGNTSKSETLLAYAEHFSIAFPNEKKNGDYLYKAGNTALGLNSKNKAFTFFDRLIDNYSDNSNAPKALFLKAFLYDTDLRDIEGAKKLYKKFLEKYPNHELARDAKFLYENAGKDANEIMKQISNKK